MNGRRYLALLQESARVGDRAAVHRPRRPQTDGAPWLRGAVSGEKVTKHLDAGLGPGRDDEELHKARKAGKRARYAAELAGPVPGKKTKNGVQAVQRAAGHPRRPAGRVVAAELLRRIAAGTAQHPDENGFTYGLLYAQELHHAQESRHHATAR